VLGTIVVRYSLRRNAARTCAVQRVLAPDVENHVPAGMTWH
jgi:hypothetical protein